MSTRAPSRHGAAFFGGVSRLTIALTVIMVEITNDVRFLLPIMLAVSREAIAGSRHSLYHALIEQKCLPLAGIALHGAENGGLSACRRRSLATMPRQGRGEGGKGGKGGAAAAAAAAAAAGAHGMATSATAPRNARRHAPPPRTSHGARSYSNGRFIGTVRRTQLVAMLRNASGGGRGDEIAREYLKLLEAEDEARLLDRSREVDNALHKCASDDALMVRPIDLDPFVNASAFSVRDDFSLQRAYALFRTMGLRHLVVTDVDNGVVGILTRRDLMDYQLHAVLHSRADPHAIHHH